MELQKKLQEQVALIERVCRETGLTYAELAEIVLVTPETMRKLRKGYQAASQQVLQSIANVPQLRSVQARKPAAGAPSSQVKEEEAPLYAGKPATRSRQPLRMAASTLHERLSYVLNHGSFEVQGMIRGLVETAYKQISRQRDPQEEHLINVIRIPRGHELRPLLGDIAAGLPHDGVEQADQFVSIPPKMASRVSFALRARGESMVDKGIQDGEIVLLAKDREPKNGDVVAALIDHEVTLKTCVVEKDRVFLRSGNKSFPPEIVPIDELIVQGVMVGKLA